MPFEKFRIIVDKKLSEVLGIKEGSEIKPTEMNKQIWNYIKTNNLTKK